MGGLIKAITPPSVSTSAPTSASSSSQAAAAAATTAAAAATATATADAEQKRRVEALERQRAGRAGTIATSSSGLLVPAEWMPTRKSLLGE